MAGSDEFELRCFSVEVAVRKSREAWESFCSSYCISNKDDVKLAGASVPVWPSFSDFLTEYGVQNLILIPTRDDWTSFEELYVVIRESVGDDQRWGREDMVLTLSGLDREDCLAAMANFGGGVYLAPDPSVTSSVMSTAEGLAFFKALCNSSTPPHTLSIFGDPIFDPDVSSDEQCQPVSRKDCSLITAEHIMMALRHNSKIRNLALSCTSFTLRFDNIGLMEGISLDRLYLERVCATGEFLQALLSLKYSGSVTHSLTLYSLVCSNSIQFSEWKLSSSSQFLHWKLKHLSLLHDSITPSELFDFMKSLQKCTDTPLESLSLGYLLGEDDLMSGLRKSAQLVGVIVDALHQSSLPILHIQQQGGHKFSSSAIEAQLYKNQQKRKTPGFAFLEAQRKVAAAAVRMFICGDPYAGKTTLLSTLSSVCGSTSIVHTIKGYFLPLLCGAQYIERTRGIEIHRITKDGIQLSLWDLAGQREFHAFHDLMFPDPGGDSGSPTIFMFVWSPVESGDERRGKIKNEEDFNNSFLYWLKFIASKTRQSNILRKLIVVITRKDQVKLLDAIFTKSSIENVAANFKLIIEVVEILPLDARDPYDVKPLVSCIFKIAGTILEGFKIYGVCSEVRKYILLSQQAQKSQVKWKPIISWEDFSALCKSMFQVTDPKIQKAIAYSLNDSGDIIYLGNLPFLVLAPNWFCREVMGSLIYLSESNVSTDYMPICHGYTKQSYLEKVLESSTHSRVEGSVLVSIMEAMHLCHKVSDDNIFIPATLFKSTTNGSRQWKMFLEVDKSELQYTYVGRRLECDRKDVTFFTPGLFPMIQVVFGKAFSGEEADLEMVEDCMYICLLDMEIIVECGRGKQGHVMDVMVRASDDNLRNDGSTLAYVEEVIVKTLIRVCAQPVGNQGVTLVESVIRPDCLHGPAALQVRDDQCVLVLDLQQKLRKQLEAGVESRRLQYLWKSSPGMPPTAHSFVDLLGLEVHMQVLMSYKDSLQNASMSLSSHHVPSTKRIQLPHVGLGSRQMEGNVDVASTSTAPTSQEEDEICEEMKESNLLIQLGHAKQSTNDSMRFVDSCQEEIKVANTDERQLQIVDTMGKVMVKAIFREVRSMNDRLKAMDARQQDMERKTDHMMHSIEKMRSDLLPGIRAMVEKCFNFAVESEAGRIPRFVFLTELDVVGGAFKKKMVLASLFKGLTRVHIELFCEHRGSPHRVEAQEGVCVTIVDDKEAFVVKALPYVKGFLKMLTLVAKVGAHVVAGAGTMVPDFAQLIGLVLDTPHVLEIQSRLLTSTPVSAASLEGWQEWLVSVLETQGSGATAINIYNKFKLRRFRFQDTGKVAWLCDEHYPH